MLKGMTKKTPQKNKSAKVIRPRTRAQKATANARQRELPPIQPRRQQEFEQYGLFCALPTVERKAVFGFTNDGQFAKHFDVAPATLSHWKLEEELWTIRDRYLITFKKHTAPIIAALAKRAERTGEAFHSLSFLKVVEGFTEKTGLDITSKGKKVGGFVVEIVHGKNLPTSSVATPGK